MLSAPSDNISFACTIEQETTGGAWLLFDGTVRAFVPKLWVTFDRDGVKVGDRVTASMARHLAVEKGFDAGKNPDQGRLL